MDIGKELEKLITLVQTQEAERRTSGDRDYYRSAMDDVKKQKTFIIEEFLRIEEALYDRDPYYFLDRQENEKQSR